MQHVLVQRKSKCMSIAAFMGKTMICYIMILKAGGSENLGTLKLIDFLFFLKIYQTNKNLELGMGVKKDVKDNILLINNISCK